MPSAIAGSLKTAAAATPLETLFELHARRIKVDFWGKYSRFSLQYISNFLEDA